MSNHGGSAEMEGTVLAILKSIDNAVDQFDLCPECLVMTLGINILSKGMEHAYIDRDDLYAVFEAVMVVVNEAQTEATVH